MFKSSGYEPIERFVFEAGRCSFQTRNGKDVALNGHQASTKPMAQISPPIVSLLADRLNAQFELSIEVKLTARGFTYHFRNAPKDEYLARPRPIEIGIEAAKTRFALANSGKAAPERMVEYIDPNGAEVVRWMLRAMCDNTPFKHSLEADQIIWSPTKNPALMRR